MELIDLLTKNLGVNETQAKGGTGLLFKLAKDKLGGSDFSKVAAAVPDVDKLIKAAPSTGDGGLGKIFSIFGGKKSGVGGLASLAGGFSKLGLGSNMISKFVPVILSFVQGKGGGEAKSLLEKVLK